MGFFCRQLDVSRSRPLVKLGIQQKLLAYRLYERAGHRCVFRTIEGEKCICSNPEDVNVVT
jgi:hypothetical protein